ncbi:MAG: hypothetical protein WDN09_02515 [bacterium]
MEIPEPKLGDYGIDAFLYKNYKDDLFVFLKYKISLKKELEHNSWFWPSFIAVIVLTIASIYVFGERWFWVAIVVYFAVYYLGLLKSQGYKKIEDAIAEIDGQLDRTRRRSRRKWRPSRKPRRDTIRRSSKNISRRIFSRRTTRATSFRTSPQNSPSCSKRPGK